MLHFFCFWTFLKRLDIVDDSRQRMADVVSFFKYEKWGPARVNICSYFIYLK